MEKRHIYNVLTKCISLAGFSETYALEDHLEYCYRKYGVHHEYTRENFKQDIESVIQDSFPE